MLLVFFSDAIFFPVIAESVSSYKYIEITSPIPKATIFASSTLQSVIFQGINAVTGFDSTNVKNWFPSNYYDIALYFKNKEGKDYKDVDAKQILGKDISSVFGAQEVKKWLTSNGVFDQPPQQGGAVLKRTQKQKL